MANTVKVSTLYSLLLSPPFNLSREGAAAVIANMKAEGGYDEATDSVKYDTIFDEGEPGNKTYWAYGICQWRLDRAEGMF